MHSIKLGTGKQLANAFEECPECTEPADGGIGILIPKVLGGGKAEEAASQEDNLLAEMKILKDSLIAKAKCMNDSLTKKGNKFVKDLLSNFEGENTEFDIMLVSMPIVTIVKNNIIKEVNAKTVSPKDGVIRIEISQDRAGSSSALSVTRTLLHEYLHSDIFRKLRTKNTILSDTLNFIQVFNKYDDEMFKANPQHNTMAELYINSLANALKAFHKEVLTEDYNKFIDNFGTPPSDFFYEALAWQGLKEDNVQPWIDMPSNKKAEIEQEIIKAGLLSINISFCEN